MNLLSTRILKKKVSKKLLSSTPVLKIDNNNKCFLNRKSGSCDTEDWSNAGNSALTSQE